MTWKYSARMLISCWQSVCCGSSVFPLNLNSGWENSTVCIPHYASCNSGHDLWMCVCSLWPFCPCCLLVTSQNCTGHAKLLQPSPYGVTQQGLRGSALQAHSRCQWHLAPANRTTSWQDFGLLSTAVFQLLDKVFCLLMIAVRPKCFLLLLFHWLLTRKEFRW